jgi:hypothetical protein
MGILKRKKNKDQKRSGSIGLGLADHGRRSPLRADEQAAPEPERIMRIDEETGIAVHEIKEPPKAEGT